MHDVRSTTGMPFVVCLLDARYIEVFRSNLLEMQKRSRPPPLMTTRPGPYDRPGMGPSRFGYSSRSRMKGQCIAVAPVLMACKR